MSSHPITTNQGPLITTGQPSVNAFHTVSPPRKPVEHSPGSRSPSALASPQPSREPSPSRQWLSPDIILQPKDHITRASPSLAPTRPINTRAENDSTLAALGTSRPFNPIGPTTQRPASLNDAVSKLWRLQQQNNGIREESRAQSPVSSPKAKSPPPSSNSRRNSSSSARHPEPEHTDSSRLTSRPIVAEPEALGAGEQSPKPSASLPGQSSTAVKSSRGFSGLPPTLETVEEGDHAVSPSNRTMSSASSMVDLKHRSDAGQEQVTSDSSRDEMSSFDGEGATLRVPDAIPQRAADERKSSDARRSSTTQSNVSAVRRPYTSLLPGKVRPSNDGSSRLMTVETETVSSIPQTSVSGNLGERGSTAKRDEHGTLRQRGSNETIKPRKEKKKTSKRGPSIISGTTSSKADIFEAKVASAVDEDTSDSDETFVYESNPPEPRSRPQRHHSRTPSVNSMQSLDRRAPRANGNLLDGHRKLRGKRSMKFASNPYNASSMDDESGDGSYGTVRASNSRTMAGLDMQSKYRGVHGPSAGGYNSPMELESPFSHASRVRSMHNFDRQSGKPRSPDLGSPSYSRPHTRKGDLSPYEMEGEGADDEHERAPLVGSIRSARPQRSRLPAGSNTAHVDYFADQQRGCFSRFAGCILVLVTVTLVVMGAAAFLFATTKPLYEVSVREVQNILASEQEIMLDLLVEAINPNIVAIAIADMDVNIFAKVRHVGSDFAWQVPVTEVPPLRRRFQPRRSSLEQGHKGVAVNGANPIVEDPSNDPQTMLLGRIFHFDSALRYDGSPLRHSLRNSTGEMRLQRPGNKTEEGGTERWEQILQHPFELIVRGILKYQLPLSSTIMTASIGASIIVHPEAGIDGRGAMKRERLKRESWDGE